MWQQDCHEESKLIPTSPPHMQGPSFAVAFWLGYVAFPRNGIISSLFWGWSELDRRVVRSGPESGPNWTAQLAKSGRSELDRDFYVFKTQNTFHAPERKSQFGPPKVVRTGPLDGPNWTAKLSKSGRSELDRDFYV